MCEVTYDEAERYCRKQAANAIFRTEREMWLAEADAWRARVKLPVTCVDAVLAMPVMLSYAPAILEAVGAAR